MVVEFTANRRGHSHHNRHVDGGSPITVTVTSGYGYGSGASAVDSPYHHCCHCSTKAANAATAITTDGGSRFWRVGWNPHHLAKGRRRLGLMVRHANGSQPLLSNDARRGGGGDGKTAAVIASRYRFEAVGRLPTVVSSRAWWLSLLLLLTMLTTITTGHCHCCHCCCYYCWSVLERTNCYCWYCSTWYRS